MTGYESKRAMAQDKLAQPEQKPVAYDKTEMNGFVQDLYDKKMQEGKHGHYETMFHVVHQAIKRATPLQPAQELTLQEQLDKARADWDKAQVDWRKADADLDKAYADRRKAKAALERIEKLMDKPND